jgi:hypothetical protein
MVNDLLGLFGERGLENLIGVCVCNIIIIGAMGLFLFYLILKYFFYSMWINVYSPFRLTK